MKMNVVNPCFAFNVYEDLTKRNMLERSYISRMTVEAEVLRNHLSRHSALSAPVSVRIDLLEILSSRDKGGTVLAGYRTSADDIDVALTMTPLASGSKLR